MHKYLYLNELWKSKGAGFHTIRDCEIVSDFGDTEQEYNFLKQGCGVIDFSYREKIKVTGNDRVSFLNNILSNDIKTLPEKEACLAALLSAQGKILSFMTVYKDSDFILLDVEPSVVKLTIDLIEKYIITEDIALEDISEQYVHLSIPHTSLRAPKVSVAISDLPAGKAKIASSQAPRNNENIISYQIQYGASIFHEILIPKENSKKIVQEILKKGENKPVGLDALEAYRIESGIPRHLVDFDETITLPETGLDKIAASETKGCYPGQEVVAKMNTYKGWPRKLVYFKSVNPAKKNDKLFLEKKDIGWLSSHSTTSHHALAYIEKPYYDQQNLNLEAGSVRLGELQITAVGST